MNTTPTKKRTVFGMAGCYAMGNFTDNFFKQAAVLLAVGMSGLQGLLTILFALPFVLFSAWAGWLSDRLPKRAIVIGSKCVELLAIVFGAFSLWHLWWPGILSVIFLMAAQSTIFTPAINGTIPENFARGDVPRVNSIIRSISTAAVLGGIALAGPLLDMRPDNGLTAWIQSLSTMDGLTFGRLSAGSFAICVSLMGLLLAFTIQRAPRQPKQFQASFGEKGRSQPFPWAGPMDSCRHILEYRKDKQLFMVMSGDAFFYGLAPIVVISIANLAKSLGYSDSLTSLLSAAIMVGIAIGALIGGRYSPDSWKRLMVPSLSGMAVFLFLAGLAPFFSAPFQLPWFAITLFCAGIWGGIYIIPIASFLQVHPQPHEKGKVLAASNFYSFLSMAIFGALFWGISKLPAQMTFLVYSLLAFGFAWYVIRPRLPRAACPELSLVFIGILALILWLTSLLPSQLAFFTYAAMALLFAWFWVRPNLHSLDATTIKGSGRSPLGDIMAALLSLRYQVTTKGLEDIRSRGQDDRPIIFLPNHPALVDPLIVYSRIAGLRPRILSDAKRMSGPIEKILVKKLGIITIPDPLKEGRHMLKAVQQGLETIAGALRDGNNLLLYPSGAIYRSRFEKLGANSAVANILGAVPNVRVVLVRTSGLWGSSFSRAGGRSPEVGKTLLSHLWALVVNALFFVPKRHVTVEFKEIHQWPADKMALNKELETYYNEHAAPATHVPYYFWQGNKPVPLASSSSSGEVTANNLAVSQEIQDKVHAILHKKKDNGQATSQTDDTKPLSPQMTLAGDFGMDSLDIMELAASLEDQFGYPIPELDKLVTVQDCLQAANGQLFDMSSIQRNTPDEQWFALEASPEGRKPVYLPQTRDNLVKGFMEHVRSSPKTPLLADRSGLKTRKDVLTAALALSRHLRTYPEKRLGIMLPATPATTIVWLALQLAGKEPVMINWTVGPRNFAHCVNLAGVRRIVTTRAMQEQIEKLGLDSVHGTAHSARHNSGTPADTTSRHAPNCTLSTPESNHTTSSPVPGQTPNQALAQTLGQTSPQASPQISPQISPQAFPQAPTPLADQSSAPGIMPNSGHGPHLLFLEDIAGSLTLKDKAAAFVQSTMHCLTGLGINIKKVPATAVILFTSGSESLPKGVPLSHHNILSNVADIVEALGLTRDERVLAMLPPFHSFGFIVGITLPLFAGVQAAFHPNPTESTALVAMVQDFKLSLMGATPTFLEGMLSKTTRPKALASLRYAFVGAEKCQDSLHALFASHCPHGAICEGYGITECSPVIAVNRPGQAVQGSIGAPLPSVECAVVAEENDGYRALPAGHTGMLLVRGPNIFAGYLDGTKPFVEYQGKSWYRTGDLVQMGQDGLLYFKGRQSRFVKIAGEMISLPQIETVLQDALSENAPADGSPFIAVDAVEKDGKRPELVVFSPLPLTLEEVNTIVQEAGLSLLYQIKRVLHLEAIPLLGSGKVDYQQLKKLLSKE